MKLFSNILSIVSFSIVGILLGACAGDKHDTAKKDNAVKVTLANAGTQENHFIQVSGQIEASETAQISTRVMGFINQINVKVGDKVEKGKLLATISNGDILAKRAQAIAMVSEAEAALVDAKKDFERFTDLYKQQSASEKELENATLHYNSVKAKAEAAKQMQNEAEAMLKYTNLTAPFAGVITQKYMDVGSIANPGMPILVIEQNDKYQVRASVSEKDIAQLNAGSTVGVVVKATGKKLNGTLAEVSPSSAASGGQYLIKVNIPQKENSGLYAGMYVNVKIPVSANQQVSATLVPVSAIVHMDQLTGLYTVSESQTALLRWVRLGRTQGDQVEVLSGLRDDESFILASESKLYNGVPVVVK